MNTRVKHFLKYFRENNYPNLFDSECIEQLKNIEAVYGEEESAETILEVVLGKEERGCDYSIKIETGNEMVKDYWYEMDYGTYAGRRISPCFFIDASYVRPGKDNGAFYEKALPGLAGEQLAERLRPMLEHCVARLAGKCDALYQLGIMSGRGQADSIRLFTDDMTKQALTAYLKELCWEGDGEALAGLLEELEVFSDKGMFILDFDIYTHGISAKIGINLGIKNQKIETAGEWLDYLVKKKLCLPAKRGEVLRWLEEYPCHTPFIQNDISHFKLPFEKDKVLTAKAYLRQGCHCVIPDFKAYSTPVLMNLELTDQCPLRCPQCYCDLTGGRELPLEKAVYWIKEAWKNGVRTVNLSGGETLCYPHLNTLISECSRRGMEPNIAVSGYGLTKERLKQLIECGVKDICVSLNGSSEEINKKTRDGYTLAIRALTLLKELRYPDVCINWVMHSCNAGDFSKMIELAEKYGVRELVVMVFKPDASHRLPEVPDEAQLRSVADTIRAYKGKADIVAEECFSQMRALLGEKFFGNLNRGISRGCGAGRDGISVNAEGKLTPCRHLDFPEEELSLRNYFRQSPVLKKLRCAEDTPEEPCYSCRYRTNCLPCMAVSVKLKGGISVGGVDCALGGKLRVEEENKLTLTNLEDEELGTGEKLEVHKRGLLHQAFSVLLYHENKVLIQKRAEGKYHSAGLWANTCCSHKRHGEKLLEAARRRLREEAGIDCEIREIGSFVYRAVFDNGLTEYEYDHVFIGQYKGTFVCNRQEAEEMKYVEADWLAEDMEKHPERYAPWFLTVFPMFLRYRKENIIRHGSN